MSHPSSLKRIPNRQMEPQPILEIRNIIIPLLTRIIRNMQGNTTIKTEDDEIQVITETETGSKSQVIKE